MAIRAKLATLDFFQKDYGLGDSALYSYQNYFPESRNIYGQLYEHNMYTVGALTESKDSNSPSLQIDFIATAANVDLIEEAINNSYIVNVLFYMWGFAESIEDPGPTDFFYYGVHRGFASTASSDFTTISLTVAEYNNSQTPDLPWRKIPWTILGPLSFRR